MALRPHSSWRRLADGAAHSDASFCAAFDQVLADVGISVIRSAVRAPRMNSIMERWFRSLRTELTDRTLIWNIPHLHRLLREYEAFYNQHVRHEALVFRMEVQDLHRRAVVAA